MGSDSLLGFSLRISFLDANSDSLGMPSKLSRATYRAIHSAALSELGVLPRSAGAPNVEPLIACGERTLL